MDGFCVQMVYLGTEQEYLYEVIVNVSCLKIRRCETRTKDNPKYTQNYHKKHENLHAVSLKESWRIFYPSVPMIHPSVCEPHEPHATVTQSTVVLGRGLVKSNSRTFLHVI